jgi:hypothetical protein
VSDLELFTDLPDTTSDAHHDLFFHDKALAPVAQAALAVRSGPLVRTPMVTGLADAAPATPPCGGGHRTMTAIRLGAIYFAAVFVVGFALGTIRTLVLVPRLGEIGAVAAELPVILAAAWIICGRLVRDRGLTRSEAAGTGAVAFVLLMLAEAALSVGLSGRTVTEHLALYGEPAHLLGLAGQMAFATFP